MKRLLKYFIESKNELAKVIWPSRRHTITMTIAVIIISIVVSFYLGLLDYGLAKLLELIIK